MIADARMWGWSWVALIVAWVIHIVDEIASDALAFYNPLIRSVSGREPTFGVWLSVLTIILIALCVMAPLVFRGVRSLKYPVYLAATLMLLNSLQHLTLLLYLQRITPGTRSAALLFVTSVWVLRETRRLFSA
jgi:hypothetical protein